MDIDGAKTAIQGYGERFAIEAPALFAWASLFLRPVVRTRLDPEDLVQEVACRAYERFGTYDASRGTFRNWVFGIARNVLREALRQIAVEPSPRGGGLSVTRDWAAELRDTATSISRAVARDEAVAALIARVGGLPEDERALVIARGLEGRSHTEVAEQLGISAETAGKRWQRLRDRLRESGCSTAWLEP